LTGKVAFPILKNKEVQFPKSFFHQEANRFHSSSGRESTNEQED